MRTNFMSYDLAMVTAVALALGISCSPLVHDPARFPEDFIGRWSGEMSWSRPGVGKDQAFKMTLRIEPTDVEGTYTFEIKYGNQQVRPYRLKPVDPANGRWQIDEGGGVLLDSLWLSNRFTSAFGIGANNVMLQMWKEGGKIAYEMTSFDLKDPGPGGVSSHWVTNIQRARLVKRAN